MSKGPCNAAFLESPPSCSLLAAAVLWWWRPVMDVELAFFSRMGAVLAAAWLAYDDVQRLPGWLLLRCRWC